jgi:beta-phosphoglucomutase-like phosphatase (HAD superfamily)
VTQAVILDVDSVDLHAKAWQEAFRHFGFGLPFDRVRQQIGKGGDRLVPIASQGHQQVPRRPLPEELPPPGPSVPGRPVGEP